MALSKTSPLCALIYSSVKWGLRQHTDHRNEETHRKRLVRSLVHSKGLINTNGYYYYHHHDSPVITSSNPPHSKSCWAIWSQRTSSPYPAPSPNSPPPHFPSQSRPKPSPPHPAPGHPFAIYAFVCKCYFWYIIPQLNWSLFFSTQ